MMLNSMNPGPASPPPVRLIRSAKLAFLGFVVAQLVCVITGALVAQPSDTLMALLVMAEVLALTLGCFSLVSLWRAWFSGVQTVKMYLALSGVSLLVCLPFGYSFIWGSDSPSFWGMGLQFLVTSYLGLIVPYACAVMLTSALLVRLVTRKVPADSPTLRMRARVGFGLLGMAALAALSAGYVYLFAARVGVQTPEECGLDY